MKFLESMQLLIFTDLDGTLLDFETYEPGPASEALAACRRTGVPVIPCTSKSAVEVISLRQKMDLDTPFIVENGAAIYLPPEEPIANAAEKLADVHGWDIDRKDLFLRLILGKSRKELVEELSAIAGELDLNIHGLSDMTRAEVSEWTGLGPVSADAAMIREFSEPFLILREGKVVSGEERMAILESLQNASSRRDLTCLLGGRFFHLLGRHTKGSAVERAIECYQAFYREQEAAAGSDGPVLIKTMALGDAHNDAEMLAVADFPVLVRRPDGRHAEGIQLPGLYMAEGTGPEGWREAVMKRLDIMRGRGD